MAGTWTGASAATGIGSGSGDGASSGMAGGSAGGARAAALAGSTTSGSGGASHPRGLNGAGKLSIPGTSTGPRPIDTANTSGGSCRTISTSGSSSRPFTIRSFTSAGETANTAAGNCSTTTSHATSTTPSSSCGTTTACGTTSISASSSRAPTCPSGIRNAPGGSCPTTRSPPGPPRPLGGGPCRKRRRLVRHQLLRRLDGFLDDRRGFPPGLRGQRCPRSLEQAVEVENLRHVLYLEDILRRLLGPHRPRLFEQGRRGKLR